MTETDKTLTQIFFSSLFPQEMYKVELSDDKEELLVFDCLHAHNRWKADKNTLPEFSIGVSEDGIFVSSVRTVDPGVWRDKNGDGYPETCSMEEIKTNRDNQKSLLGACRQIGTFIFDYRLKEAVRDYEIEKVHLELEL